ncbi:MAG: glutamate racemase [Bacteroidia bacterium]
MDNSAPIGVFDSGIGGLTVASAIHKMLPNESIIYFGDTAHFPYGNQSPEQIESYGLGIARFLKSKGCKMIVIACNTASAHSYKAILKEIDNEIPVINVIDPASIAIASKYPKGSIGVIGTAGTIKSGIYKRRIQKFAPEAKVSSLATPLLAPMIEEGYFNNKISSTIIHSYLEKKSLQGIQALILACTHYPLIKKEVESFYNNRVEVVDSAQWVAQEVKSQLEGKQILSESTKPSFNFYVSYLTQTFEKSAKNFFPSRVDFKEMNIWK